MQPYFSVIIPLYNKEKYISKTIESVLNQTYSDFEVLVINDGSTDKSTVEVEKFNDSRLRLIHQENKGASSARNLGIQSSNTEFIAFLDADDIWHHTHLEIIYNLTKEYPEAGIYTTGYLIAFNTHSKKATIKDIPEGFKGIIPDFFKSSLYDSPVNSSVAVIKKPVLQQIKGYDLNIKSGQDIDLWIRIALNEKVAIHNIISATYLKNDESLSNSIHAKDKIKYLNKFLEFEQKNSSLKSFMDMNRFSVAIFYKILNKREISKTIYKDIDLKNLSFKQRFVYNLPQRLLKLSYALKKNLDKRGMFFNLYR